MKLDSWQHVDPRYKTQLRILATIQLLVVLAVVFVGNYFAELVMMTTSFGVGGAVVLAWLFWVLFWIPRRYRLTRYRLAESCVHFRVGALWRSETSVTHNRLQHLELEHGPLERVLGLCRVVLYTAGGQGADLTLPGMERDTADEIKKQLLSRIEDEQLTDEPITENPDTPGSGE